MLKRHVLALLNGFLPHCHEQRSSVHSPHNLSISTTLSNPVVKVNLAGADDKTRRGKVDSQYLIIVRQIQVGLLGIHGLDLGVVESLVAARTLLRVNQCRAQNWGINLPGGGPPGAPGKPGAPNPAVGDKSAWEIPQQYDCNLRGPPRPANPGGPPKPPGGNGGAGPPTPAAGPVKPIGAPRPAGRLMPGPDIIAAAEGAPPGALVPRRADGSAGGGPSTEREMTCVPRMMVRPSVRFSSVSLSTMTEVPGAPGFCFLDLIRLNSSVSAKTRFMCCRMVSIF
jgi:hypothetical protein